MISNGRISSSYTSTERIVLFEGDCLDLLHGIPDKQFQLIVTSPPYNIGKEYEKKLEPDLYLQQQAVVIEECIRTLSDEGSICW